MLLRSRALDCSTNRWLFWINLKIWWSCWINLIWQSDVALVLQIGLLVQWLFQINLKIRWSCHINFYIKGRTLFSLSRRMKFIPTAWLRAGQIIDETYHYYFNDMSCVNEIGHIVAGHCWDEINTSLHADEDWRTHDWALTRWKSSLSSIAFWLPTNVTMA
jgi:hypothetical protein